MKLALAAESRVARIGRTPGSHAESPIRDMQLLAHLRQAAEIHNPDSASHMLRMAQYARLIASGLGLSYEQQETVLCAASLHDIGKIGIPDSIASKRGPLDEFELLVARRHVLHGHAILRHGTSPLVVSAAEIALRHHEKFDGSGYPDGLAGEAIPLYARIATVADVFDALTSHRPHRAAIGQDQALEYVRAQRGTHFDPQCVDAFLRGEHRIHDIRMRYRDPGSLAFKGN
jgi:response regulator RpfG family c-di-GMP phosphodiesterase